jgi:hypothetical protein
MKNFSFLSSVSFYVVFSAIPQVHGKDLASYMSGIYWVAGAPKGLKANDVEFENKYLPLVDKTLKENKYLSGIYIEIPWNAVEPEEQKFDLGRVGKIVELARKNRKFYKLNLIPGKHAFVCPSERCASDQHLYGESTSSKLWTKSSDPSSLG